MPSNLSPYPKLVPVMPTVAVATAQAGMTGTVTLTITDKQGRLQKVEFQTEESGGTPSAWTEDASAPYEASVPYVVDVPSFIRWRIIGFDYDGQPDVVLDAGEERFGGDTEGLVLDDLVDVEVTAPDWSHVLTWNDDDQVWENRELGFSDLADTDGLDEAEEGNIIRFNGTEWVLDWLPGVVPAVRFTGGGDVLDLSGETTVVRMITTPARKPIGWVIKGEGGPGTVTFGVRRCWIGDTYPDDFYDYTAGHDPAISSSGHDGASFDLSAWADDDLEPGDAIEFELKAVTGFKAVSIYLLCEQDFG